MKFKDWLTEATKEDFWKMASLQRDLPEKAMLKFQRLMPGSTMGEGLEHVGDISHRMAERPTFAWGGYNYVKEKVLKTLSWIDVEGSRRRAVSLELQKEPIWGKEDGGNFHREFINSIKSYADYYKEPYDEYRKKVMEALENYSREHEKLPTYNKAHQLAQAAAVNLGRMKYAETIRALRELESHLGSSEEWIKFAHENLE